LPAAEGGDVHTIIWRYRVRGDRTAEFERAYGPQGDWARFFARSPAYSGTRLYREAGDPAHYLTIDEWRSRADHDAFRAANEREYAAIDRRFEAWTESEECLLE
jgi:heme-degrading monooxygenase HmoA